MKFEHCAAFLRVDYFLEVLSFEIAGVSQIPKNISNDPILKRFRAALGEVYGNRLERVVLYGSRARRCACLITILRFL